MNWTERERETEWRERKKEKEGSKKEELRMIEDVVSEESTASLYFLPVTVEHEKQRERTEQRRSERKKERMKQRPSVNEIKVQKKKEG